MSHALALAGFLSGLLLLSALAPAWALARDPAAEEDEVVFGDDDDEISFGPAPAEATKPSAPDEPATEAAAFEAPLQVKGEVATALHVQAHTSAEDLHIAELSLVSRLQVKKRLSRRLALKIGALGRYHHYVPRGSFAGVPDSSARTVAFVEADEVWLDLYLPWVDLRIGNQRFAWGANPGLSPADVLGAMDLRFGFAGVITGGDEAKLPVPALSARAFLGPVTARVVLLPVYIPDRVWAFGYDLSLASARLPLALPDPSALGYEWTGTDQVQPFLLHTSLPSPAPENWQGATRLEARLGTLDLGLTAFDGWDRIPRIRIDPELLRVMAAQNAGETPPIDAVLALLEKMNAGETLFESTPTRTRLLAVDATFGWRDLSLRADLGYSPRRNFFTLKGGGTGGLPTMGNARARVVSAVLGAEWLDLDGFTVGVVGSAFWILGLPAGVMLPLFESMEGFSQVATRKARDLLVLSAMAYLRYVAFDERLEVIAGALLHPAVGDGLLTAQVGWRLGDHHRLALGTELLGGLFGAQDRISLTWTASL